jgi:spermidine synthase
MDERVISQRATWLAVPLVFVSGLCALIYQVVWTRELRLVFGASTAASSAVVAIFIAGLGFGGLWWGRRVERTGQPLRFYALLELAIAATSGATPLLLYGVRLLYVETGGSLTLGLAGSTLVRLALAALVLGPPTFLMGGTLPAIARAIETEGDRTRRGVAVLYGVNTLGAVLGCMLATFVWLEQLGSRHTLWLACVLNVLVALVALLISGRLPKTDASGSRPDAASEATLELEPATAPAGVVFASAAVVGFAFFLMELVWYRILQPVLGGTVFTFGLILAIALLGIGVGSAIYAAFLSGRRTMLLAFAITCVAEAACMALPFALGDRLAIWGALLRPLGNLGFEGLVLSWAVIAGCAVLPAAIVAGFQFPLLIALLGSGRQLVARDVGRAYAANTLGAVLGALAGGFGLLPLLGALGAWRLAAGLLAGWGLFVGLYAIGRQWGTGVSKLAGASVFILFALSLVWLGAEGPTAAFRHSPVGAGRVSVDALGSPMAMRSWRREQRHAISWQTDGIESAIGISRQNAISFVVNGKSDGNSRTDAPTQVMGGLVGAALKPSVRNAMVIGLGTGSTAGWLAQLPEIERVDVAELEPAISKVARLCAPVNHDVLRNPKVQIFEGDARELLSVSRERYDLIFSEPSNPYRAGVASLYTREYYQAIRRRLARGGVFVQWLQAYEVDAHTLRSVYATLGSVFAHVETYHGVTHDLLLVATRKKPVYDLDALAARLRQPPFVEALRVAWYAEGLTGFLSHYLANPAFTRYATGDDPPLNTDDRTEIEFGFARNLRNDARGSAASLFESMRAQGENRPAVRRGSVDWAQVDYEHAAFALTLNQTVFTEHLSPQHRDRLTVINYWMQANYSAAIALWNQLGLQGTQVEPTGLERMALAESFAYAGGPGAGDTIKALTYDQPTLGPTLHAVWQMQNGERKQGSAALVAALERYRTDPWPRPEVMARALSSLQQRNAADQPLWPSWLAALSKPFSVHANDILREQVRFNVAHAMGPSNRSCLGVLSGLEPHMPWLYQVLEFRAECYRAHGHPLQQLALRELAEFRAGAVQTFEQAVKE